ncbi:MAG TPA: photosynthetic complex assembly protein PuhC [Myxococcaceae bacterium]|nr:photosynthetic complex assembly protein PuhC [Myxococcaceae bacterium]
MSHSQTMNPVPRGVLLAAGALLALTLVLTAGARLTRATAPAVATAPAEAIEVRFEDRPDGSIAMLEPASGRELARVPPASNGFIRGVLRGLFRERKLESLGRAGTFRIERRADGRLALEDLATHRRIDLTAFGPDNTAAFARLLEAGRRQGAR